MGKAITDFGMQIGQGLLGGAMGQIFGVMNDKRQLKQQGKLQELEMKGQREMTEFNYGKQLQMWKDTNYKAQMEQLEMAGLNPGLIYGMSGGGGATTNVETGKVTGGHAPTGGGEAVAMANSAMQLGLLRAQKENIEADTANKKADIPVKNVTVPRLQAETDSIRQGIKNAEITESILKWEDNIKRIESNIAEQTQGDKMGQIVTLAEAAASTAEMIERDNQIAEETKQDKIKLIKAESLMAVLKNGLIEAQTAKEKQDIKNSIDQIKINWRDIDIKTFVAEFNANHPNLMNTLGGAVQRLADGLSKPQHERKIK